MPKGIAVNEFYALKLGEGAFWRAGLESGNKIQLATLAEDKDIVADAKDTLSKIRPKFKDSKIVKVLIIELPEDNQHEET